MFETIQNYLKSNNIDFRTVHHEPTPTSEDSARARGEDISTGGKALVLKVDSDYRLFVLSASKQLNSKAIKKHFHAKKIRFATKEELFELTGLVPGSIPPFGQPILHLDLYLDTGIFQNKKIAFNAGSLTDSIVMNMDDYLKIYNGKQFLFSK